MRLVFTIYPKDQEEAEYYRNEPSSFKIDCTAVPNVDSLVRTVAGTFKVVSVLFDYTLIQYSPESVEVHISVYRI